MPKFEEVEDQYEANLLRDVYGGYKLQTKLNNMKLVGSGCKFEEMVYKSHLGGAFGLKLTGMPEKVFDQQKKLLYEAAMNRIVLSIHAVIKEDEKNRFVFFGKKIVRSLIIQTIATPQFFFKESDAHGKRDFEYCIQSFKEQLEAQSGMKVKEFSFDYKRE